MANKSKKEKKKRAKTKKRLEEELRQKAKKSEAEELAEAKKQGESEAEALATPEPKKDTATVKATEFYAPITKGAEIGLKRVEEMDIEEPFDPKRLIDDILKKKDGA